VNVYARRQLSPARLTDHRVLRYAVKDLFRIGSCRVRDDSLTASGAAKRASELDRANEKVPFPHLLIPRLSRIRPHYFFMRRGGGSSIGGFTGTIDFIACCSSATAINLNHDFLSPPDRIGDGAHGYRNLLCAFILGQLACCQNRRSDQQQALSCFVHKPLGPLSAKQNSGSRPHRIRLRP
jgi:hypothetical protein